MQLLHFTKYNTTTSLYTLLIKNCFFNNRPGGEIGRHARLKILFAVKRVRVQFPPRAHFLFFSLRDCVTIYFPRSFHTVFDLGKIPCSDSPRNNTAKAPIAFSHNHPISVKKYITNTSTSPIIAA